MNPGRTRTIGNSPLLPLLFVVSLAGCERVDVDAAVDGATRFLRAVRPGIDVSGVRIRSLRPWSDTNAMLDGAQRTEAVTRRRCLVEHADLLQRFQLLSPGDFELLLARVRRGAFVERLAFANHRRGEIWVPPEKLGSVEFIAHELARIASTRQRHGGDDRSRLDLTDVSPSGPSRAVRSRDGYRNGFAGDARRIDLDALLALDLLREADAAFTTEAASRYRADGESGVAELWRERVYLEGQARSGFGPFSAPVISPSGGTLSEALDDLARRGSRSLVQSLHCPGEGIEPALERAWSGFSYTTRELLFPRAAQHRASRFAASARHLHPGVRRILRIGAFFTWRMLLRETNLPPRHVLDIVRSFGDDILVQSDRKGSLWITEWSKPETASAFAGLYGAVLDSGRVEVEGRLVIASFGDVPDRDEILRTLR